MKCEVERFERGTDLTINDWISQMETYFTIGQVPPEEFVGFMLMKIVPRDLNEIKQYQSLDYLAFREKLVEVFEEPDLSTAYLNALASLSKTRDESISDYMHRARLLVLKAHPDISHASRERILITSFLLGLYNRQLASSLAVVKIQTAADVERLAAEGKAVISDQRSRRSTSNFLPERRSGPDPNVFEEPPDAEPLDEKEEELMAALETRNPPRMNDSSSLNLRERRRATSVTRCYGCGQYGHFKSDCPRPDRQGPRRVTPRAKLECLLCNGDHFVRNCPSFPAAQQATKRSGQARETEPQKQIAAYLAQPSTSNERSATVKRDGTAVLSEPPYLLTTN